MISCIKSFSGLIIYWYVSERYLVLFREGVEVISMYSVLASREPEGYQVSFFNPS